MGENDGKVATKTVIRKSYSGNRKEKVLVSHDLAGDQ